MKKTTILVACALFSSVALAGALPAHATSDSDRLQNRSNNLQEHFDDYSDEFDAVLDFPIEYDDSDETDEDYDLAVDQSNAATPIFTNLLEEVRSAKTMTGYIKGIHKKQRRALRVTLNNLYIDIKTSQLNMVAAFDREDSYDIQNGVEDAINEARGILSNRRSDWHDAIETYLRTFGEMLAEQDAASLEEMNDTYDLYKDAYGEGVLTTLLDYKNSFSSSYSEGVALLNQGKSTGESRDLQLMNRGINKFIAARSWAKKINSLLGDLEVSL